MYSVIVDGQEVWKRLANLFCNDMLCANNFFLATDKRKRKKAKTTSSELICYAPKLSLGNKGCWCSPKEKKERYLVDFAKSPSFPCSSAPNINWKESGQFPEINSFWKPFSIFAQFFLGGTADYFSPNKKRTLSGTCSGIGWGIYYTCNALISFS